MRTHQIRSHNAESLKTVIPEFSVRAHFPLSSCLLSSLEALSQTPDCLVACHTMPKCTSTINSPNWGQMCDALVFTLKGLFNWNPTGHSGYTGKGEDFKSPAWVYITLYELCDQEPSPHLTPPSLFPHQQNKNTSTFVSWKIKWDAAFCTVLYKWYALWLSVMMMMLIPWAASSKASLGQLGGSLSRLSCSCQWVPLGGGRAERGS